MKTFQGYRLITPDDLHWRPSNLMKIQNADYLERTGSENLGARLWRLPPKSANTLHKHIRQEEFYFVLEGTGRMRVGEETLTVPRYGGVLVEDALMGVESFQASQNYYWFQLENSGAPVLSFAARLPDTFARNGKFAGTKLGRDFYSRRVTFTLAADANGGNNLILRQTPILMDMDPDALQYPLILARNVKKFSVEWWDFQQREWSSKDWVNTNSIPPVLRVNLVLGADTVAGGTAPDFAAARILTVPSTMMPVAVQRGGGGAPPGLRR